MSTALAIAGVTAVLRDRLNDGMVNHNITGVLGSTVTVSVLPPDRVVLDGGTESSQLNLFLYQVTPNTGWRNASLPSRDDTGTQRLSNPPLELDLHYMSSAYSGGDPHAEILLGYAMQLLHEFPALTREMIRTALNPSPDVGDDLPPALRALADCGLADQMESLRITPQYLCLEDMSRLWTATQSHYRPTVAYQVSVVLIEATRPTRAALPVLTRGAVDPVSGRERGVVVTPELVPPLPTLEAVLPPDRQPVVRLGDAVVLEGHHLDGTERTITLRNERHGVDAAIAASGPDAADRMGLVIPVASASAFPVGVYDVTARMVRPGESVARSTNRLACIVAPNITTLPQHLVRDGNGDVQCTITFTPQLRPGQRVALLLGDREILPEPFAAPTASLPFIARDMPPGAPLARLRIDGIESPVANRAATPPTFYDHRITIT